ncbi:MAG: 4Fe-4S binding protein [Bacteroidales bacterium]|nr:4Fe-4S binding protein [Bacteroidales bacterium]
MSEYLNIIPKTQCTGCGACSAICPHSCIAMCEDNLGFKMPVVDLNRCIHCDLCKRACPVLNAGAPVEKAPLKMLAAKNTNSRVAAKSSSGGAFSAFAESIIDKKGIVYGVELNSDLKAVHVRIDDIANLSRIQSSKYIQSNATPAYPLVKEDLKAGKDVLFSGTPCQIAALRQYLRKDYPNLLCVEVICHGVPSNLAFQKYIDTLQDRHRQRIISVNFRDKSKGWDNYHITFTFEGGKQFSQRASENLYCKGYVSNLFVRESCTDCKFKAFKSGADITLGDMWGIEHILPSYNTDNGVSMISINTPVGQAAFDEVISRIKDCADVAYEDVKKYNACIYQSVPAHPARVSVLEKMTSQAIVPLIKQALGINYRTITKKKFNNLRAGIINSLIVVKHKLLK